MLNQLTISELTGKLAKRECSAREAMQACLDQIQRVDRRIKAFLGYDAADALAQAEAADTAIAGGADFKPRPLLGVPVAVKDVLCVKGHPCNCGSKILGKFVSPYDATVIERLKAAGAIVFGRLNMDEFAMGSSTENSAFFTTLNPWDTTRIPGGSSGGSAAAVAADEAIATLGSDTGGSIRQPAALCGVVGLKPTYGRVSRYGLVAFASSLDQVGPLARTVEDVARVAAALCGWDPRDATSAKSEPTDFAAGLEAGAASPRLRVGVPWRFLAGGVDEGVMTAFGRALEDLRAAGAELVDVDLPHLPYAIATYYIVATAEASSNLARYDGVRYGLRAGAGDLRRMYGETRDRGFGLEVKRRIVLGTFVLSSGYYDAYYLRAQKVRTLIRRDFEHASAACDVMATPTSPIPAFRLGERTADPLQMYLADIFTVPASLAGIPGLSIPCGFVDGLPAGLQLLGRPFDETTLLRAGHAYQSLTTHHLARPPLS